MLTGDFIDAERAVRTGLASDLVPDEELEGRAQRMIDMMLANSPVGVRLTKECLNMSVDAGSLEAAIAMEDRQQILSAQTDDMREGISAFLGKRPPEYRDG
jgi:enoyl-CoA hydratase